MLLKKIGALDSMANQIHYLTKYKQYKRNSKGHKLNHKKIVVIVNKYIALINLMKKSWWC